MVLVSPADHAQHAKVRAEEQHVSEHAERNTWVSTYEWAARRESQALDETKASQRTSDVSWALAERDRRTRKQRRRGADAARKAKS